MVQVDVSCQVVDIQTKLDFTLPSLDDRVARIQGIWLRGAGGWEKKESCVLRVT